LQNQLNILDYPEIKIVNETEIKNIDKQSFWCVYRQSTWQKNRTLQFLEKQNCFVKKEFKDEIYNETVKVYFVSCVTSSFNQNVR
jgi:hypothetical protein